MGARTGGRAVALQVLYALDAAGMLEGERRRTIDVEASVATYFRAFEDGDAQSEEIEPEARSYALELLRVMAGKLGETDQAHPPARTQLRPQRLPPGGPQPPPPRRVPPA